jgi:hypothetical protein
VRRYRRPSRQWNLELVVLAAIIIATAAVLIFGGDWIASHP